MEKSIHQFARELKSRGFKKPNKEKISKILEELYSNPANEGQNKDLALLLVGLLPSATKIAKNDFDWVLNAVSKNDARIYLQSVYCDGERIVATNGYMMLSAPSEGREVGFYNEYDKKVEVDSTFPDYKRLIPDKSKCKKIELKLEDLILGKQSSHLKHGSGIYYYSITEHKDLNKKYLENALNGETEFVAYYKDYEGAPVLIETKNKDKVAIIMPLRK